MALLYLYSLDPLLPHIVTGTSGSIVVFIPIVKHDIENFGGRKKRRRTEGREGRKKRRNDERKGWVGEGRKEGRMEIKKGGREGKEGKMEGRDGRKGRRIEEKE